MAYSATLPDVDLLFLDGSAQNTFNSDTVQILHNAFAIATVDKTEIALIINVICRFAHLETCFTFALSQTPRTVVLTFDINVLHFKLVPNPRNFTDMSQHPFADTLTTAPAAPIIAPTSASASAATLLLIHCLS